MGLFHQTLGGVDSIASYGGLDLSEREGPQGVRFAIFLRMLEGLVEGFGTDESEAAVGVPDFLDFFG